jgi:hypothetical protein
MKAATAVETESSLSSRDSLVFCVAVLRFFSMIGQLRLETIYLIRGYIDDMRTMKSNNLGKSVAHSSSASTTRYVLFRLGSCSMSAKMSDKATHAFASSNIVLPACSYFFCACEMRERSLTMSGHYLSAKRDS